MKKYWFNCLLLIFFLSCGQDDEMPAPPTPDPEIEEPSDNDTSVLTGYNMRWRDTPNFDQSMVIDLIDSLNPEILRYPGGTLAHKWDWQTGLPVSPNTEDVPHHISDVKKLAEAVDCKITFVLDIVNSDIDDQIAMLEATEISIEYIELGNELYADDYETIFPDGASYAALVNEWTPDLRMAFPNAKIGAVLIGRTAGNDRKNFWNAQVTEQIFVDIDAYIYHIYVNETESVQDRIDRFESVWLKNLPQELWITEYGAKSQNLEQTLEIADYVDSIADLSLNHCVVARSGNFSKMTIDGNELTKEGLAFVERYQ